LKKFEEFSKLQESQFKTIKQQLQEKLACANLEISVKEKKIIVLEEELQKSKRIREEIEKLVGKKNRKIQEDNQSNFWLTLTIIFKIVIEELKVLLVKNHTAT
jgi:hypothetical protein